MKLFTVLFSLILSGLLLGAQTKDDSLEVIRKRVNHINNTKGLVVKVLKDEEFPEHTPDGGGELKGYFKDGKLVKIAEWIGLSSCTQTTEYYLQDGKLIFIYLQGKDFDYLTPTKTTKPKLVMECRFYYTNDQLIKSLIHGKTKCSDSPDAEWAKELRGSFLNYRTLLELK